MERHSSVSLKIVGPKKKLIFYSAREECKRRIVKTQDDASDVEMGPTVLDDSICVGVEAEVNEAADTNNKNKSNDGDGEGGLDPDGEGEPDVPGDAGGIAVEEGTDPKDINEDNRVITDDEPDAMMCPGNACADQVLVPDDKSSPETANNLSFHTTTEINRLRGNPPLAGPYPTAPTTNIHGGNPLFPGASPITPTMEINGENANPFTGTFPVFHPDPATARYNFPEESHGTHILSNPYSCDFSLTSANLVHSATPSLNPSKSTDFWFGNYDAEYNCSAVLTFPQGAQLLYFSAS